MFDWIVKFNHYILGALLISLSVASAGWYVTNLKLDSCKESRKTDKVSYEKAQAEATVIHMKAIKAKEQVYVEKAREADASLDSLNTRYASAIRLYTEEHRRKARSTGTSSTGGSTSSDYRSSEDTELPVLEVIIPTSDLLICAENTARLVVARDWALGLNE